MLSYIFNIKRYILPLILSNTSLYRNASRQTLSERFFEVHESTKYFFIFTFETFEEGIKDTYTINSGVLFTESTLAFA